MQQNHFGHRWTLGALLLILLLAATLRLVKLDQSPPWPHVDESSNAWNAYTLLKTGKDEHGVRWPIFYTRAFGENHSAVILYALLPFQAVGGMNVWTTRLPVAVGGVISVWLIYFIGARLFGSATGLVAAAMLAVNPWHLQTSRIGLEGGLVSPLILASLAALLWANMPFDDDEERRPRPALAAFAGAVAGISCYGYWAVRIFLPIFFIGAVLVTWSAWWKRLKTREWRFAIGCLVIAGAVTFGPLAWEQLTDPEIGTRAQMSTWAWDDSDSLGQKIGKALSRYPGHFGRDFLFISGDHHPAYSLPPGTGLFYWYDLPLMLLGLITLFFHSLHFERSTNTLILRFRFRSSRAARFLLMWVVLYPAGDLLLRLSSGDTLVMHSWRSLPGVGGFVLLAAVGAVSAGRWIWRRRRPVAVVLFSVVAFFVIEVNARFFDDFFSDDFNRQKYSEPLFVSDMLEAAQWLRPRLNEVDAVFITGMGAHFSALWRPYVTTLVGLRYDPEQWFRDARDIVHGPLLGGRYRYEDVYMRFGKIHFLFDAFSRSALREITGNNRQERVIFILRPEQHWLVEEETEPVYEVRKPEGEVVLQIFDVTL